MHDFVATLYIGKPIYRSSSTWVTRPNFCLLGLIFVAYLHLVRQIWSKYA